MDLKQIEEEIKKGNYDIIDQISDIQKKEVLKIIKEQVIKESLEKEKKSKEI